MEIHFKKERKREVRIIWCPFKLQVGLSGRRVINSRSDAMKESVCAELPIPVYYYTHCVWSYNHLNKKIKA